MGEARNFNVVLSEPLPERFTLVVGFPGIGLTGFIDTLLIPPTLVIVDSEPKPPIRIFKKDMFVIIKSEVPVQNESAIWLGEMIIKWAESMKANKIIILDGLPTPGRTTVNERTIVWGLSSNNEGKKILEGLDVKPISKGVIMGVASILFMESKKLKIDCYGLFGESFSEFPDMRAAASVICKFSKLVSIPLEVTDMINMASEFEHSYTQQFSQVNGEPYSAYSVSNVNIDGEKSNRPSMYG
ncbi:MAG: PAC2 family protein [Thermoplasmata archaeon]